MVYLMFTLLIKGHLCEWTFIEHSHLNGLDMEGLFLNYPLPPFCWHFPMNGYTVKCFCGFHCYLGSIIPMVFWKRLHSIPHTLLSTDFVPDAGIISWPACLEFCITARLSYRPPTASSHWCLALFQERERRDREGRKEEGRGGGGRGEARKAGREERRGIKERIRALKISYHSKQKSCLW